MVNIAALKISNAARWKVMHTRWKVMYTSQLTTNLLGEVAAALVAPDAKTRYQTVSMQTGVPWFVIAGIHEREASQSWAGCLVNGDPWDAPTIHVPVGIGPWSSWADSAIFALEQCAPFAARNKDWSIGGLLTLLERYNGLGYAVMGLPSPYLWAGTDQYKSGKFVSDGHYDPDAIDRQLGCAAILARMAMIDQSVVMMP